MTWQDKALAKLVETIPGLLIVIGSIFLLLGISGGIAYNNWLPIRGDNQRVACAVFGLVFVALGIGIWFWTRQNNSLIAAKDVKALGIKILYPREGSRVRVVTVQGTFEKLPPPGYELRSLRYYPNMDGFIPHGRIIIDHEKKTWEIVDFDIGGEPNAARGIEICLAGHDGQVLLDNWTAAHQVHKETLEYLKGLTGKYGMWLGPMTRRTHDLTKCARVKVIRSQGGAELGDASRVGKARHGAEQ